MKNSNYNNIKKGFVLSLILWITTAMMLLSILFIRMSKEESSTYKALHKKLELILKAQSLFEKLSFYISTGKFHDTYIENKVKNLPNSINIDNSNYNISIDNDICHYSLLDHSALFNIRFLLKPDIVQNLIEKITDKNYSFHDIFLDWIDRDNLKRLNGAEKNDYILDDYAYINANYVSFQHRDSITLLKDYNKIDQNKNSQILKYITVYGSVPINIMLIDIYQLSAFFPNKTTQDLKKLIYIRKINPNIYIKSFKSSIATQDDYNTFASKTLTLDIDCKNKNIHSKLKAIVNYKVTNAKSWAIEEILRY